MKFRWNFIVWNNRIFDSVFTKPKVSLNSKQAKTKVFDAQQNAKAFLGARNFVSLRVGFLRARLSWRVFGIVNFALKCGVQQNACILCTRNALAFLCVKPCEIYYKTNYCKNYANFFARSLSIT